VLAACASDHSGRERDEVLTLATAFLAAGAVGVVGARWEVADIPTAIFMIMFHHYLNAGYADPATALRAAQLWMLDPRRRLPVGLDERLAHELSLLDLAEVDNWAAFTYQGR
jgi:CHAT domain-containing protein